MSTDLTDFKLCELCLGSHKNRGTIVPAHEVWARSIKDGFATPCFHGAVFHSNEAKAYVNKELMRAQEAYQSLRADYETAMAEAMDDPEARSRIKEPKKPRPSLAGYRGEHYAPFFMIDVDTRRESPDMIRVVDAVQTRWRATTPEERQAFLDANPDWEPDTEAPRNEAMEVIRVLMDEYGVDPDALLICFSGNKGFHIYVPSSYFDPEPCVGWIYRIRWMVQNGIVPKVHTGTIPYPAESIDWQVYTPQTVLRAVNSVHQKSGLYKIPVGWDELQETPFDLIREGANAPRAPWPHPDWRSVEKSKELRALWEASAEHVKDGRIVHHGNVDGRGFVHEGRLDFDAGDEGLEINGRVPNRPLCILKLMRSDVGTGNRNPAILLMTATLRDEGYTPEETFLLLQRWLEKQVGSKWTDERLVEQIEYVFESGFQWGCNHSLAMANCFSACRRFPEAKSLRSIELFTLEQSLESLREREREPITYYFPYEPFQTGLKIRPGKVIMFVAQTGLGKTAISNDICRANSAYMAQWVASGELTEEEAGGIGMMSLEMPKEELAERIAQYYLQTDQTGVAEVLAAQNRVIDARLTGEESIEDFARYRQCVEQIRRECKYVRVCEEDRVDLEKMRTIIRVGKETANIGFWIIDYMGRMHSKGHNSYERLSELAKGFKTVAREEDVALMVLVQVSRAESDKPSLGLRSGRGSGEIEESADIVITAYEDRSTRKSDEDDSDDVGVVPARSSKLGSSRAREPKRIVQVGAKNRGGEEGLQCVTEFHGATMTFVHIPAEDAEVDWGSLGH